MSELVLLYRILMTAASPDAPPAKNRKFEVKRTGTFDNTVPGCEWKAVYGEFPR